MYDEKLVTDNINLVFHVLKKMYLIRKQDDYKDIGMIGLIKAAKEYDSSKGYNFSTFACRCIENEIIRCINEEKTEKNRTNREAISMNKVIYTDGNTEFTLEEVLASDVDIFQETVKNEQRYKLYDALLKLNEKDYDILCHLYELNGRKKMTAIELGKKYNVGRTEILRKKRLAIERLKKIIEEE